MFTLFIHPYFSSYNVCHKRLTCISVSYDLTNPTWPSFRNHFMHTWYKFSFEKFIGLSPIYFVPFIPITHAFIHIQMLEILYLQCSYLLMLTLCAVSIIFFQPKPYQSLCCLPVFSVSVAFIFIDITGLKICICNTHTHW